MNFTGRFIILNEHLDWLLHTLENVKMTLQNEETQPKPLKQLLESKLWPLNKTGEFECDSSKV
jgi:hypothetical protein